MRFRRLLLRGTGQGLVEFALVVPLLLLLVIGIAEFGRAWMTRNILTGAAREAVRIAVISPPVGGVALGTARGQTILDSANLTGASIAVDDPGVSYGVVTATASFDFQSAVLGFIPGLSGTIPLVSQTTMRREY